MSKHSDQNRVNQEDEVVSKLKFPESNIAVIGVRSVFNSVEYIMEKEIPNHKHRKGEWIIYDLKDRETWDKEKKNDDDPTNWATSDVKQDEKVFHCSSLHCKSFGIDVGKISSNSYLFLVHFVNGEEPFLYCEITVKFNYFCNFC